MSYQRGACPVPGPVWGVGGGLMEDGGGEWGAPCPVPGLRGCPHPAQVQGCPYMVPGLVGGAPCLVLGLVGGGTPCPVPGPWDGQPPPPLDRQTENITFPHTLCVGGKNKFLSSAITHPDAGWLYLFINPFTTIPLCTLSWWIAIRGNGKNQNIHFNPATHRSETFEFSWHAYFPFCLIWQNIHSHQNRCQLHTHTLRTTRRGSLLHLNHSEMITRMPSSQRWTIHVTHRS